MKRVALVRQCRDQFEINHTHPMGLMYLAASLRKHGGFDIRIFDNVLLKKNLPDLADLVAGMKPDVVGLTGLTVEAPVTYAFLKHLRQRAPGVFTVMGGAHSNTFGEDILRETDVDAIVPGEGEISFANLMTAFLEGRDFTDVPGISFRGDGHVVINPPQPFIEDLDSVPFPAWDLIDVKGYFGKRMGDLMYSRPEQMTVFTSRGCPYGCCYCHHLFGRKFRARSPENVVAELRTLIKEYGVREIQIEDDVFNFDMNRAKEIFRRIIDEKMDLVISFPNGMRADHLDDELITLMYRAGARRLAFGVESASPGIMNTLRKHLDLEKLREVVGKTTRRGILTTGYFMLGFPGETREDMMRTINFARSVPFHTIGFSKVIPFKGTPMYEVLAKDGKTVNLGYAQYEYDYSDVNLSAVDDREIERIFRIANSCFYLGYPRRLLRFLKVFPNKKQIFPYYFFAFLLRILVPKRSRKRKIPGEG